jgi:hemoglobin/transferrin/lactoferrin receptor protein
MALAGLVNFITREPSSYLRDGKTFGGSASIAYSGDDNGWNTGLTLAGKPSDTVQWLVSATANRAHELENMGENYSRNTDRTAPNPERDKNQGLLAKVILTPNADQRHTFTLEHVDKTAKYDLLSGLSKPPLASTSVIGLDAKISVRLSAEGAERRGRFNQYVSRSGRSS